MLDEKIIILVVRIHPSTQMKGGAFIIIVKRNGRIFGTFKNRVV